MNKLFFLIVWILSELCVFNLEAMSGSPLKRVRRRLFAPGVEETFPPAGVQTVEPSRVDTISDDVLVEIFSNLSLKDRACAESTCKRWKRCVEDSLITLKDGTEIKFSELRAIIDEIKSGKTFRIQTNCNFARKYQMLNQILNKRVEYTNKDFFAPLIYLFDKKRQLTHLSELYILPQPVLKHEADVIDGYINTLLGKMFYSFQAEPGNEVLIFYLNLIFIAISDFDSVTAVIEALDRLKGLGMNELYYLNLIRQAAHCGSVDIVRCVIQRLLKLWTYHPEIDSSRRLAACFNATHLVGFFKADENDEFFEDTDVFNDRRWVQSFAQIRFGIGDFSWRDYGFWLLDRELMYYLYCSSLKNTDQEKLAARKEVLKLLMRNGLLSNPKLPSAFSSIKDLYYSLCDEIAAEQ